MFKRKAFTLIELLIVIAIIAILAGIIITATTGATKKARDSKRVADMKMLYNAIVQYEADHGHYPSSLQALVNEGYISSIPVDPQSKKPAVMGATSTTYIYQFNAYANPNGFILAANLERDDSSALDGDIDKTISVFNPSEWTISENAKIKCADQTACDGSSGKHCYCIGVGYYVIE